MILTYRTPAIVMTQIKVFFQERDFQSFLLNFYCRHPIYIYFFFIETPDTVIENVYYGFAKYVEVLVNKYIQT